MSGDFSRGVHRSRLYQVLGRAAESGRISRRKAVWALCPFGGVAIEKQDSCIGGRAGFARWHITIDGRMFNGDTLLEAFENAAAYCIATDKIN